MTQMQVFNSIWGSSYINGTAYFNNITVTQGGSPTNYGNVTYSGSPTYPGAGDGSANLYASQLGGAWDLTAGDLILSYTANLSGVIGPSDIFAIGLQPFGLDRRTPPGGGWMAMTVASSAASPGILGLNDKFDLQNGWADETAYNVQEVPEPTTILLLGSGLLGIWAARKRFKK